VTEGRGSAAQLEERYRQRSLWLDGVASSLSPRPHLPGDATCDVAIVGAGFTGLWTAYYLKTLAPELRVAIVEREIAGFGASGRNGGGIGGTISGNPRVYARHHDPELVRRSERLAIAALDDIAQVIEKEGIDCTWRKGGWVRVAVTASQRQRIDDFLEQKRRWGAGPEDWRLLERDELETRVRIPGALAGLYTPHAASVDPGRFVRGLADAVERLGANIYERTAAIRIEAGRVVTQHGIVRARHVVRATEAFTVQLPGEQRRFLTPYSLMIATEPLGPEVWGSIGLENREHVGDLCHLSFYGQRTTDDRLALGGRGVPYRLGSPVDERNERQPEVVERLTRAIAERFPAAAGAKITHHWGGAIAVPRDWCMSVHYDPSTGLGWAGGYSGGGMNNSHLCGRAMSDLVLGRRTELTELPWIGHSTRRWEFEPLRLIACRSIVAISRSADRVEQHSTRTARRIALVRPFVRGHG
jgi:glycine/D-amino acid oxidase-like deaminating enzyme